MVTTPTVLLVEHHTETRAIFRLVLESAGFEVIEASGAEEGVDRAVAEHPDVILADLVLSGLSGVDVARILQRRADTGDIPIVAATGSVAASSLPDEIRQRFVEVLEKPVRPDELIRALRQALDDSPYNREDPV